MTLPQLRRIRWGVRLVLLLGVAASVTANVLHARHNPVSQAIAAWPPLALLLTVELISRVPIHRRSLAVTRLAATAAIAGIAAWVSYWHMTGVAARYGEQEAGAAYLLPLSVDGLVVIASICLVELAGRLRALAETPAVGPVVAAPDVLVPPAVEAAEVPAEAAPVAAQPPAKTRRRRSGSWAPARRRRPVAETRRLVAELAAAEPDLSRVDMAKRLGLSERRLREVLANGGAP